MLYKIHEAKSQTDIFLQILGAAQLIHNLELSVRSDLKLSALNLTLDRSGELGGTSGGLGVSGELDGTLGELGGSQNLVVHEGESGSTLGASGELGGLLSGSTGLNVRLG
jgi:hypothetical protein